MRRMMSLHFGSASLIGEEADRETVQGKIWRRNGPISFIYRQNRLNNLKIIGSCPHSEIEIYFVGIYITLFLIYLSNII